MDIKSKNYNNSRRLRVFVFILCVVLFIGTLTAVAMGMMATQTLNGTGLSLDDILFKSEYKESLAFQWEFEEKAGDLLNLMERSKYAEPIESGGSVDIDELNDRVRDLFYSKANENDWFYGRYGNDFDAPGVRELFKADYMEEIDNITNEMIDSETRQINQIENYLNQEEGFSYYAADSYTEIRNISGISDLYPERPVSAERFIELGKKGGYLIYENGKMVKYPRSEDAIDRRVRNNDRYLEERLQSFGPELRLYFAFDEGFISGNEKIFKQAKADITRWIPLVVIMGILTLAALIWLIVTTGRKNSNGTRPHYRIDRIFTEIRLMIIAACFFGGGYLFIYVMFESIRYNPFHFGEVTSMNTSMLIGMGGAMLIGLASASLGLLFILSCVRSLKEGRFLKNSLIYRLIEGIWGGIRSIYRGGSIMRKVVLLTLAVCLLSATVVLAPVVGILILIFAPRWVRKYDEIRKGVNEVKNGNLGYKIPLTGEGELERLAADINEISEASNIAIQNELKNQRLKTELISNVSHDLRTPLTSIITYVDLLKAEGPSSENFEQYVEVLEQKGMRLKKLTEDLFDAAKASSGAVPVKIETVDMLSLINQGLGEMAAGIGASGLDIIVNAKEEKYYVSADGQLLWRVVENLLVNVLKYALPGSRVYIDLREIAGVNGKDGQVLMEIKNISKAKLNINADELMERFTRGDESRTSEGSGLGLAIAKDLIILQEGWFEVKIDGDLFKALVMLPKAQSSNE